MIRIGLELSYRNVFNKVDSYDVFKAYCTNFKKIGEMFKSEFRDDQNPSCCIIHYGNDLLYTDFGEQPNTYSRNGSYRAINFVMRKFGLKYYDALQKINIDFGLGLGHMDIMPATKQKVPESKRSPIIEHSTTVLKIKKRPWKTKDLSYWSEYYWTREMLEKANIHPISHFWIHNYKHNNRMFVVYDQAYSYDYYWSNGVFRRKIYFPLRQHGSRFISNVDDTIVQGWDLLPKENGDTLFITKSFKDIGPFWRLGYHACAPNNEKSFIPEKVFEDKIRKRFEHIYIWYDNDETGISNAKLFSEKYRIPYIHTPLNDEKDPTDYAKKYGLNQFHTLLKSHL
jgi:hypothetical protein